MTRETEGISNQPSEKLQQNESVSSSFFSKHGRMLILLAGIFLVILIVSIVVYKKKQDIISNPGKTYSLKNIQTYTVLQADKTQAVIFNFQGNKTIKNAQTTFIYNNLPPHEKKASFTDLKPKQEIQLLAADKNTIVYIVKLLPEQAVKLTTVSSSSTNPEHTVTLSNPEAFKDQVDSHTKWIYNSPPPKTLSVTLVSTPQKFVFIKGTSGNTISTSSVVNGEHVMINLYIENNYLKTESPALINNFATGAVLRAIFSGFSPTQNEKETLSEVSNVLKNQQALVLIK